MSLYEQLCKIISTHSAHEDGDCMFYILTVYHGYFNPLRPRGRRRLYAAYHYPGRGFQPTPPTRTETELEARLKLCIEISTHSAHEDGDSDNDRLNGSLTISTHSAHEDGDF